MANIAGSYDQNAEPASDFSPIPTGTYRAKIIESDIEDISKKEDKGRCLKLTWMIETGPYDGRLVWQRLNLYAANFRSSKPDKSDEQTTQDAINGANRDFASIREATGRLAPQESVELHDIPCSIYVALSKPQPGYNQQNEIKSVKAISSAVTTSQANGPSGQGRFTPPANNTRAASPQGQQSAPWPRRQSA